MRTTKTANLCEMIKLFSIINYIKNLDNFENFYYKIKLMKKIIGTNFFIDVYKVKNELLDEKFLLKLLNGLIKLTKTIPVGKPFVKKISSSKYPYSGYSIFQIIQESHLALHTWPEYNYLAIDIFSCKPIPEKKILNYLKKSLNKETQLKFKKHLRILIL